MLALVLLLLLCPYAIFALKGDNFFKSQKSAADGCWWRAKVFYDRFQDGLIDLESKRTSAVPVGGTNNFINIEMLRKYLRARAKQTEGIRFDRYKRLEAELEAKNNMARKAEAKGPLEEPQNSSGLSLVQRNRLAFENASIQQQQAKREPPARGKGNIDAALDAPSTEAKYEVDSFGSWTWHPWYSICIDVVKRRREEIKEMIKNGLADSLEILSRLNEESSVCIDTRPHDIRRLEVLKLMMDGWDISNELATFEQTESDYHQRIRNNFISIDNNNGVAKGEDAYTLVSAHIRPFEEAQCLPKRYKLPLEFYLLALENAFRRTRDPPIYLINTALAAYPQTWKIPDLIARTLLPPAKSKKLYKILAGLAARADLANVYGEEMILTKVSSLPHGLELLKMWRNDRMNKTIPKASVVEDGLVVKAGSFSTRKAAEDLNLKVQLIRSS